jgi:UrcA family protein
MTILHRIGFLSAASFVTLLAMGISISPALAKGAAEMTTTKSPPSIRIVSYADLELASNSGAEALQKRIRRAAQSLCGA